MFQSTSYSHSYSGEGDSYGQDAPLWKEIVDRKDEFQQMLKLLLAFDEHSGRCRDYREPELHYMRRAVAVADPSLLRIYLRELGRCVYYIVTELHSGGGRLATAYVHEDGIRQEREQFGDEPEHPVHGIVCLSDLYEAGPPTARVLPEDLYEIGPGAPGDMALELMNDESLFVD